MLYSQAEVLEAAQKAYSASACQDPDYIARKSELFVERCVRAQNVERGSGIELDLTSCERNIEQEQMREVCWAALDSRCTAAFWMHIAQIELRA